MAAKPKAIAALVEATKQVDDAAAEAMAVSTSSTRRRLTDDDRANILKMHADSMSIAMIAASIPTSINTVRNTLMAAGALTGRTRAAPINMLNETQKRLLSFAVATLMGDSIDETERNELKQVLNEKVEAARREAVQRALANI